MIRLFFFLKPKSFFTMSKFWPCCQIKLPINAIKFVFSVSCVALHLSPAVEGWREGATGSSWGRSALPPPRWLGLQVCSPLEALRVEGLIKPSPPHRPLPSLRRMISRCDSRWVNSWFRCLPPRLINPFFFVLLPLRKISSRNDHKYVISLKISEMHRSCCCRAKNTLSSQHQTFTTWCNVLTEVHKTRSASRSSRRTRKLLLTSQTHSILFLCRLEALILAPALLAGRTGRSVHPTGTRGGRRGSAWPNTPQSEARAGRGVPVLLQRRIMQSATPPVSS